ncbi:MAG: bifunctional proline dehydrogenase/L-glutamate gamma-semialdehyde dehydrogenase [Acidimicrobiia bacterium]
MGKSIDIPTTVDLLTWQVMSDLASNDAELLADDAVRLVTEWLAEARRRNADTAETRRLAELLDDPSGPGFAMRFVDLVIRPEDPRAAAHQLRTIVTSTAIPRFLGPVDRLLLRLGALVAPLIPRIVLPLARARMRALIGHLIADAEPDRLTRHLHRSRQEGNDLNVNLLGEAVLGDAEATRRLDATIALLERDDVDYASVKISSIVSELNLWAFDHTVELIEGRLRRLYRVAGPDKFVNLDMEEYADLDLTIEAFIRLLSEPEFDHLTAGIVLQAYLPDSFPALQRLSDWAAQRRADGGGGEIKVRLVKGANLAMERVDAEIHGWEQAPYATKTETDANYKRCLDWAFSPERMRGMRIGVASHNLFDVAWAMLLADRRGVADRVDFEMLQGMAPAEATVVREAAGGLRLYTPVVARSDFDTAISYLFRRLEENSDPENFISSLFDLDPGGPAFAEQEQRFRQALAARHEVSSGPRRDQDRTDAVPPSDPGAAFANAPDTDPAIAANRRWAVEIYHRPPVGVQTPMSNQISDVDAAVGRARAAGAEWARLPAAERRRVLRAIGDSLERRRPELISAMIHEGSKTIAQADPEVSEAVDFARYYADRALDLETVEGQEFQPLGVVAVVPPWNFPVAIPAGGVLAALAAGNGVVFKPAPEVPRCAEVVWEAMRDAGLPADLVQYIRVPDNEVGRHLITHPDVDAVILTGSYDTASLFNGWKPDLRLFAETSGKNALIVTPNADLDLAAADLVNSAFGHAGQKCSAASLAILVGSVYESARFRRQIVDAARSLVVGDATDPATDMTPLAAEMSARLERAFTVLDPGESWLLEPRHLGGRTWTPGIKDGVRPGSWFHQTECFGPVLGLMRADDFDHAIELQNAVDYGLTAGIHSLDADELDRWSDRVEAGNAYLNRHITGAIVRRQPFGGWKKSSVGPGAKAGGPNYVAQFGHWHDAGALSTQRAEPSTRICELVEPFDSQWLADAVASDAYWEQFEFGLDHDPSGLVVESNVFRYRARPETVIRAPEGVDPVATVRVLAAAIVAGTPARVSSAVPIPGVEAVVESNHAFRSSLSSFEGVRVRHIGPAPADLHAAAWSAGVDLIDGPVMRSGRLEMLPHLREQALSRTRHRFGNVGL